jgi:transcriptional regulator with XRE-family HTH domain
MHRVGEIRRRLRITQEELAAAVGLTQGAISKIETGESDPGVDTLIRIAAAMNVSPRELLPIPMSIAHPGFSDCAVTSWAYKPANGIEAPKPFDPCMLAPGARSPATYLIDHDGATNFGLPRNTVIVVDLSALAKDGDLAIANLVDMDAGIAVTVLGRRLGDYLIGPRFTSDPNDRLVIDAAQIAAAHPVVAWFSAPRV